MKKDFSIPKSRKIKSNPNLQRLTAISTLTPMIESRVDPLMESLKEKYTVNESKLYDMLYLKVRKMFLEDER